MTMRMGAAFGAALFLSAAQCAPAHAAAVLRGHGAPHRPATLRSPALAEPASALRPWVEGVTPPLENQLFDVTYKALPHHNVLKVYVFDTTGFESAGIRFSARLPHESGDLSADELQREAVALIRATFERFPQVQTLDVWATIPIPTDEMTQRESTVFSVSADRPTYESIRDDASRSDESFLAAFGQVFLGPEIRP